MKADIGEVAAFDFADQLGDAVLEYLAPDKADFGVMLSLLGEVLASAKPDFKPDFAKRRGKEGYGIKWAGLRQRDR
jgi:hypothetical protein